MAKIYRKSSDLQRKYQKYRFLSAICAVILIAGLLIHLNMVINYKKHFNDSFTGIIVMLVGFVFFGIFSGKRDSYKSGIKAEERTSKIISGLPDDYIGITNVKVVHEGRVSEIDMVLAGPTGVFVIETKSRNGEVSGNAEDKYLYYTRLTRERHTGKFYNPMKQVGTHVFQLSNYLKKIGINVWVQGVVYFDVLRIGLRGRSQIPYYSDGDKLVKYILTHRPKEAVTEETVNKIVKLLN